MSESLRQIKQRIRSVENIRKITRAMEMVSLAKFRRTEDARNKTKKFVEMLEGLLEALLSAGSGFKEGVAAHPFLDRAKEKKDAALCLVTSDSGLCGLYNDHIGRAVQDFMRGSAGRGIRLTVVGKKGLSLLQKLQIPVTQAYVGLHGRYSSSIADKISSSLMDGFLKKQTSEVYLIYSSFDSTAKKTPVTVKILPVEYEYSERNAERFIIEPDGQSVMKDFMPVYIRQKIRLALLEAFASEHSSRMISMKTATDNAKELIENLVLIKNKVRQTKITREVIEIISAAEALRG